MMKKRTKIILIVLCAVVVLAVVVGVAGQYWVVPAVIRSQISSTLSQRWDGRAEIKSVGFSWGGSVKFGGIDLYDTAGRQWLHVDAVELGIHHMISTQPVLQLAAIKGLAVQWHYGEGVGLPVKQAPPVKPPPSDSGGDYGKYVDLRDVRVEQASLALIDQHGKTQVSMGLDVRGVSSPDGLSIAILGGQSKARSQGAGGASGALAVDGVVNSHTFNSRLKLTFNHRFTSEETAAIMAAAGQQGYSASGDASGHLTIEGPLSDPPALQVAGQVDLSGWEAKGAKGPLADGVESQVKFSKGHRVDIALPKAGVLKGKASGAFFVVMLPKEPVKYGGNLTVTKVDMARLNEVTEGSSKLKKGLLTGDVNLSGRSDSLDALRAQATANLEDADMMNMPILPEIVKAMGVSELGPMFSSDAAASVTMAGQTITVERAVLSNAVTALETEKGGTVNLDTHRVDLYVVGVPVKQLTPLLNLPVISLVSNLEKKLTRVHVMGPWTDPPASLIRVEPMSNVSSGTAEFFQSAAKGGGKLGSDLLNTVKRKPTSAP